MIAVAGTFCQECEQEELQIRRAEFAAAVQTIEIAFGRAAPKAVAPAEAGEAAMAVAARCAVVVVVMIMVEPVMKGMHDWTFLRAIGKHILR